MNPSDDQLILAYVEKGDQYAFKQLVDRHQDRIFGFLMGMVRDRDVANDLFQETFIRVIGALRKERSSYNSQGRFLAWALQIARFAALDYFRSQKKWQDVSSKNDDDHNFWDTLIDEDDLQDVSLMKADQKAEISKYIDRLSPAQREVILLRHDAELTFKEIAAMLDCSINTALGRMRYALVNLRKMMDPDFQEGSKKKKAAKKAV